MSDSLLPEFGDREVRTVLTEAHNAIDKVLVRWKAADRVLGEEVMRLRAEVRRLSSFAAPQPVPMPPTPTQVVLLEVFAERIRQNQKFGVQDCPVGIEPDRLSSAREFDARLACDIAFRAEKGTWALILEEEYRELLNASGPNLRTEAIQVAAVLVAMVECLDRNK